MHIAFLSCDRVGDSAFDRDTALIGAFEALGANVTVMMPVLPAATRFEYWRSALLGRMGYNVSTACDVSRLRCLAAPVAKVLRGTEADVVFSRSTHFTAWLDTPLPIVNYVDAVFDCIVDFYPTFTKLDPVSRWAGHRAERRALHRSNLTVLKSFWAAGRAIRCYKVPQQQVGVVQAPAILPKAPTQSEALSRRVRSKQGVRCLVIGNEWRRKGADIAMDAVRKARMMGLDVRLVMLGMQVPPGTVVEPWMELLPPQQKGLPGGYEKMCQEFLKADVLLVPSRADFSPNVVGEACAFGLPAIGSPVGAIPEMIEHGQTGFVSQQVDDADEYARFLFRLATEPGLLSHMSVESRNKYEAEFALPVAARKLMAYLESVLYRSEGRRT